MFDKSDYSQITKDKSKSNQGNNMSIRCEKSIQESTKKPRCSSESEKVKPCRSHVHFKIPNKSMHKKELEYLDIEEYIDSMDLKNRSKCAVNTEYVDEPELINMAKFIYKPDPNDEMGQGDKLKDGEIQEASINYIVDSNPLSNVDSTKKHVPGKVNVIDYNYNIDGWNYNLLDQSVKVKHEKQPEHKDRRDYLSTVTYNKKLEYTFKEEYKNKPETSRPDLINIKHITSKKKSTSIFELSPKPQAKLSQKKHEEKSGDMNNLEYIYFDKSDSESEDDNDNKINRKKADRMDYLHVPQYDIDKTLAEENKYTSDSDAKIKETSLKLAVKQKDHGQSWKQQRTQTTTSQKVTTIKKKSTRARDITRPKKTTIKMSKPIHTTADMDLTSSWDYYYHTKSRPHFNIPPRYYSRVKLTDERPFVPGKSTLASIFHSGTPRLNLFFQPVDNKFSMESEYLYSVVSFSFASCLILCCVCLIVWFIHCNKNAAQRPIETYQFQIIVASMVVLCVVSCLLAIIGLSSIHTAFENLRSKSIDPTMRRIDEILEKLSNIRDNLSSVDNYVYSLRNVVYTLKKFGLKLDYFLNSLNEIQSGKNKFYEITIDFERKFGDVRKKAVDFLWTMDQIIFNIGITFWMLYFFLIAAVVIMEQFKEKMEDYDGLVKLRGIISRVAVGMMAACWLMAAITASGLLFASDFCSDPVESVIHNAPLQTTGLANDTIRHYMTCGYSHAALDITSNPSLSKLTEVLQSAVDVFDNLHIPGEYRTDLIKINKAVQDAMRLADSLKACDETKAAFMGAHGAVCEYGLNGLFCHLLGSMFGAVSIVALLIVHCSFELDL